MTDNARPEPFISRPPQKVLFLCIHNSARSQLAEGFAHAMAPPDTQIWSAGTESTRVHPVAIRVMGEAGIDITKQASKTLEDVPWKDVDTVVTLCGEADEACPTLASTVRRVHWPLPDPSEAPEGEEQERAFREAREEIRWRVSSLWPRGD